MFKSAMIFAIEGESAFGLDDTGPHAFTPCGPTQPQSTGWVPPRGIANGPLVENIGGQLILKLMIETKIVPSEAVARALDERCAAIEQQTGCKPGKKQRKELKEEVVLGLLPAALTKRSTVSAWLDRTMSRLVIDTSSGAKAELVVQSLISAFEGLVIQSVETNISPAFGMRRWLQEPEALVAFSVDRECELKASDETKAVVRYGNHALDIAEVRDHLDAGKEPTRLAMTWKGRVSLLLTDSLELRKVALLDGVKTPPGDAADAFDADAIIYTGEMRRLIDDLLDELGGEKPEEVEAKTEEEEAFA